MDRRSLIFVSLLASLAGFWPSLAHAHPVTVDGVSTMDWMSRAPAGTNSGIVARDDMMQGELVWTDASGDTRTDISSPEDRADLTSIAFTADDTNLYVRLETAADGFATGAAPVQVQIAVDLDRASGSGQTYFAGLSDTQTDAAASWEYLIQTQATGAEPSVRVLDTSFTSVGTGTIAAMGTTIEIAVPWALFGVSAPASAARFTVGLFREDTTTGNVIDIGGPTYSDAVDAVTDYGDPTTGPFPNTFAEVSDQVINYYFDAWFDGSGEVYAPLSVTRFLSNGTEWIELRNQTPVQLELGNYEVGDATVDAHEGMGMLPAGTLTAGASIVVAGSSDAYVTAYGDHADAAFGGTDTSTPNMVGDSNWASGSFALANGGDQILVLGPGHIIDDVVAYGSGTYSGIISLAAPGAAEVPMRDPVTQDTDDCSVDFAIVTHDCASMADCGSCQLCDTHACVAAAAGASCDDGDACTQSTTCDALGACGSGSPVTCDDSNVCTGDSCDSASGCVFTDSAMGTSCADGNLCNGDETCDGAGTCASGTALDCDDMNPCTADACDPTGGCTHTPVAMGVGCDDGNACTTATTCDGAGTCGSGSAVVCDDMNPCTADMCDPALGCANTAIPSGTSCDDGDACTSGTTCDGSGACGGGSAVTCPDDGNPCTAAACDSATGCATTSVAMGTSCDDGDPCTAASMCDGMGSCGGGTTVSCDDMNPCTADACDGSGGCTHTPLTGTACDDGDACTSATTCDASGTCGGGTTMSCDDGNACTMDACDSAAGCMHAAVAMGMSCDDGSACTTGDACDGAGSCAGTAVSCDDSNACTSDSCDATTGCVNANVAAGTSCDDGNACTTADACDGSGSCAGGSSLGCDDGNPCTADSCDSTSGCAHTNVASGTSCDDGDACTTADACDGSGACMGTPDPICMDAGMPDAGMPDAGMPDAGMPDAGLVDGGLTDARSLDASVADASVPDASLLDAGPMVSDAAVAADASTDGGDDAGEDAGEDAGPNDASVSLDATTNSADAGGMVISHGCSCRAAGGRARSSGAPIVLALLGLALIVRRRRR